MRAFEFLKKLSILRSFRLKLITSFLLLIIPIIILGFASYYTATSSIKKIATTSSIQTIKQVNEYIGLLLENIDAISMQIFTNENIQGFLSNEFNKSEAEESRIRSNIQAQISDFVINSKYISDIVILGKGNRSISSYGSYSMYDFSIQSIKHSNIYKKTIEANGKMTWFGMHPELDIQSPDKNSVRFSISASRTIKSADGKEMLGILIIDLKYSVVKELLNQINFGEKNEIYLISPDGRAISNEKAQKDIIYNNIEKEKLFGDNKNFENDSGAFNIEYKNSEYLCIYNKLGSTGYMIIGLQPINELYALAQEIAYITVIIGLLVIAFTIFLGMLISSAISKPISIVSKRLLKIAETDGIEVKEKLEINSIDEIGELVASFNKIQEKQREHINIIKEKSLELQEKNTQVMESIDYAKMLQVSMLPDNGARWDFIDNEYFVIWKPRDVVGGDFYWFKSFKDSCLIAIIDCTGHGVPGALMTMTVNALLNKIAEDASDDPSLILEKLDASLKNVFHQEKSDFKVDDGADAGICLIKPKTNEVIFSGARISLFCCENGNIEEYKGLRRSLGCKKGNGGFVNSTIKLNENSIFYLSTDGLFDQNKEGQNLRFGKNGFKELITRLYDQPMDIQKMNFEKIIEEYMGKDPQRDDITVMGFKVK